MRKRRRIPKVYDENDESTEDWQEYATDESRNSAEYVMLSSETEAALRSEEDEE